MWVDFVILQSATYKNNDTLNMFCMNCFQCIFFPVISNRKHLTILSARTYELSYNCCVKNENATFQHFPRDYSIIFRLTSSFQKLADSIIEISNNNLIKIIEINSLLIDDIFLSCSSLRFYCYQGKYHTRYTHIIQL